MKTDQHSHRSRRKNWAYWLVGLGSLGWLLLRSGTNPRRLAYPCQRAALASSSGFLGYLASLLGLGHFYRFLKQKSTLVSRGFGILVLLFISILAGSNAPTSSASVNLSLPSWTHPGAISNVYAVENVPTPECSLDGGTLPATGDCSSASYALHDDGVDSLIAEMDNQGDYFFKTAAHPTGTVGADDVVVIKINNQWAENGGGRLCTNTDVLKGLMWQILQHPDGFSGEIVVAENTQGVIWNWDHTPANSQDPNQSYQDVISAFQSLGYPVSLYRWDDLNDSRISGGDVGGGGYPIGEYAHGNNDDAYILLEDTDGTGTDELSYPKFQSTGGISVSMRYGVWDGSSYDADRLTLINMPVLKQHGMAGATIAWKNLIGFVTTYDNDNRYGGGSYGWDEMHDFYWGYTGGTNQNYGLLGRQMALIHTPDLNVVDATWVADDNYDGNATRQDILLASRDPFAVDWYASEYILYALFSNQDASAARSGIFRNATRTNQNSAASEWPTSYPYMDLLDSYDGSTPSDDEKNQMNVYVVSDGSSCEEPITGVGIGGPTYGYTDTLTSFTAVVTPASASVPITYTWEPTPDVGADAVVSYTWATTGEKTITVTAENCGGSDTAVHTVTILPAIPGCPFPVQDVTIAGPSSGYTDTIYTFEAIATSAGDDPTPPITYTWSPTPAGSSILPGQTVVSYTWPTTGTKTITVTAENCNGDSRDVVTHTITIRTRGQHNVYLPLVLRNYGSSPSSGDLIQPDDLTYLGAFRLPDRAAGDPDEESWEYSGQALTYRPDGDPGNTDGHPGSLFGTGHDVYNYVSEISIPTPSTSRDLEQLNVATTLQGFHDVRGGLFAGLTEMPRVGMQYLPAQAGQTSAKLHLAWGAHHHDEGSSSDTPSHAWCDLNLSAPNTQGAWWIGDAPLYRVNGYIFEIPQEWADTYVGGARLATGRYRDGGWSGMGPNVFAYGPWLDGSPPISGTHLIAHTVLSYSFSGGAYALANYHDSDEWEGGAWLTEGDRSAVVLVGTKGGGDYWWYGYSSPGGDGMPCPFIPPPGSEDEVRCYNSDGTDCAEGLLDCEGYELESKGWWSSRFDAQIMFYDPADFTAVLNGTMEPYEPQPYATLDIDEHLFLDPPADVETDCGTGDQRKCRIGEVAYDRERGFLYVLERFADDSKPVVHVWRVD